jgi:hypothetical protein
LEHDSGWSETSTDEEEDVDDTAASPSTPLLVEESLATNTTTAFMSSWRCYKCMNSGYLARDCTLGYHLSLEWSPSTIPANESNANRTVKFERSVTQIPPVPTNSRTPAYMSKIQCRACDKFGHYARNCPNPSYKCYKCLTYGHFARDCTVGSERSTLRTNERSANMNE